MATSTLEWSGPYISSVSTSDGSAANWFDVIYNAMLIAEADSDFQWEIADYSTAGSTQWICLKRKAGGAGRIVICYTSATLTFNAQIHPGSGTLTTNLRCFWVPGATSDVPANITGSGDIFTGTMFPNGPITPTHTLSAGRLAVVHGCDDGITIACRNDATGVNIAITFLGDLIVDIDDDQAPISGVLTNTSTIGGTTPQTTFSATSPQLIQKPDLSTVLFFGGGQALTNYSTLLRDIASKKVWFPVQNLISYNLPIDESCKYSLRQISMGIVPLSGDEVLYGLSTDPIAIANIRAANAGLWLLNFKLVP